ncbi:DNA-binding domain-containing protein [Pelagibius sp.]|uniref:HvfC/BufC N-terminal domain-containing protein n=1 Tax=Pelagibius sp. TaxID=1931238 RepID=UPI003B50A0CA
MPLQPDPLAGLQSAFSAALRDPALPAPQAVAQAGRGPLARGFDVYRNNVAVSLIEALEAAFPVVRRLVGEAFFKAVARAYVAEAPPCSPVLLLYGRSFGTFLDDFPPAARVPYLGDVARLEWARLYAYHAADAAPLEIASLSALPEGALGGLRFTLHPSLRLLRSRWPVVSIWAASSDAGTADAVDMGSGQEAAAIRPALTVETRLLPAGGHDFIADLVEGATLSAAAEQAIDRDPAFELAVHLQGLFEIGAVTALLPSAPDAPDTSARISET